MLKQEHVYAGGIEILSTATFYKPSVIFSAASRLDLSTILA